VGIDDFAFLKGHSYGCIICDLSSHKPIDVLPNRELQTVTDWFLRHPSIQVVSRDASYTFKRAVREANASIIQVSDRFHIIQNIRKCVEQVLKQKSPSHIHMETLSSTAAQDPRVRIKRQREKEQKKWELAQYVQQLRKQALSLQEIATRLQLHYRTVQKYANMRGPLDSTRGYRPSPIDPYMELLRELVQKGHSVKDIDQILRKNGYEGKYSTVRIRVEDYRRELRMQVPHGTGVSITNKKCRQIFMSSKNPLSSDEERVLKCMFQKDPTLTELYNFYHTFIKSYKTNEVNAFKQVIVQGLKHSIAPIREYCKKIYQDIEETVNSFLYSFNNGLLEGQVNRLKTIKRMMYGRGSVELLRIRVLHTI
jgi:transposase